MGSITDSLALPESAYHSTTVYKVNSDNQKIQMTADVTSIKHDDVSIKQTDPGDSF